MNAKARILLLVCAMGCGQAFSYELETHAQVTYAALGRSQLKNDVTISRNLGLEIDDNNPLADRYFDVANSIFVQRSEKPFEAKKMPEGVGRRSVAGWLMRGAIREDDLSPGGCMISNIVSLWHSHGVSACNPFDDPYGQIDRVVNHFYDPVKDRGLTTAVASGARAVDWALGTANAFAAPNIPAFKRRNHFTVMDAREAMYSALTRRPTWLEERT